MVLCGPNEIRPTRARASGNCNGSVEVVYGFAVIASGRCGYTHLFCWFDHSSCTVYPATCLKVQAQISPISPLVSSYQPEPGTGSVIASHSSCELVPVSASKACIPPRQPLHVGYGITA